MGRKSGATSGVEAADGFDYGLLFVVAEFGVDGQGEYFGGGEFGLGKIAGLIAEVMECDL
jgi:hypothetical protein